MKGIIKRRIGKLQQFAVLVLRRKMVAEIMMAKNIRGLMFMEKFM